MANAKQRWISFSGRLTRRPCADKAYTRTKKEVDSCFESTSFYYMLRHVPFSACFYTFGLRYRTLREKGRKRVTRCTPGTGHYTKKAENV